jgi:hypothetical protein
MQINMLGYFVDYYYLFFSFSIGDKWFLKPQTCRVTDKLYHIMLYTSPGSRLELTTSVVIGTDCICSCKSNYHMITTMTSPLFLGLLWIPSFCCVFFFMENPTFHYFVFFSVYLIVSHQLYIVNKNIIMWSLSHIYYIHKK